LGNWRNAISATCGRRISSKNWCSATGT